MSALWAKLGLELVEKTTEAVRLDSGKELPQRMVIDVPDWKFG